MLNTPAGIEGMFRAAGRDKSLPPLPAGESFQPSPEQMAESAEKFGNIIGGRRASTGSGPPAGAA